MNTRTRVVDCVAVNLVFTGLAVAGWGCASARAFAPVAFDRPASAGALAPEGVAWVTRSIDDPLRIRLSKHVAAEPAELFVRARIPPDPRNRALRIEWWTPAGVGGSHSITLDGDQSARQQKCAVRRMGAGEYIVTAVLLSSDGSEVRRKTRVIVTGESRLW